MKEKTKSIEALYTKAKFEFVRPLRKTVHEKNALIYMNGKTALGGIRAV